MSETPTLSATARDGQGTRDARRLRRQGRIPGILYGHGEANQPLVLDELQLERALGTPAQVFKVLVDGREVPALVKDVQYGTFGKQLVHVDLLRVDLSEEIEVEVPLEFVGTPKGLEEGGVFETRLTALGVACRADAIPDQITVEVAELDMGDQLHVSDIVLPRGLRLVTDEQESVCGVVETRVTLTAEEEEAAAEGEAAESEGEGEGEGGEAAGTEGESESKPTTED